RTSSGVDAPQRTHVACHGDDRWMSADGDIGDYPHPPVVRRAPPVDRLALSAEAVYVAWPDDRIDAYSRDGTPRWTVWPHDPGESVTALLAVPGGVVSGGLDAAVVALDEAGAELWRERAPGWGPRLATDGSSVLAATPDGVWLRPLAVDGSLTELPMTGTVDVAWRDGSWWLSTADGSVVQRAPDLSLVARHLGAPPIRALSWDGDVVVAGDDDGRIGRWSADGALLDLTCAQRDPVQPASSPRIERRGDRYVVGGRSFALPIGAAQVDGRRLAVGLVDGHVVWPGGTAELGRPVTAIALGPDERLAVATVDGTLWLYDGEWVGRRPDGSCPAP
ncbi:MAG: WD40 repeat protein, partial [Myxococcota bacterium]